MQNRRPNDLLLTLRILRNCIRFILLSVGGQIPEFSWTNILAQGAPHDIFDETIAKKPRHISHSSEAGSWPCSNKESGQICIKNDTPNPIQLRKNNHFCQVRWTEEVDLRNIKQEKKSPPLHEIKDDPSQKLPTAHKSMFEELHESMSEMFLHTIGQYND